MGYKAPLSKHQRDVRLGYVGVGVGAAAFVLMVATTLQVTDTDVPGLPVAGPPETSSQRLVASAQDVVPAEVLVLAAAPGASGVAASGPRSPAGAAVAGPAAQAPGGELPGTAGPADEPPQQPTQPPAPEQPGGPQQPGQPEQPGGDGGPEDEPAEGPVSALVDPVVVTAAGAVDRATGGASGPLTTPLVGTVDGATDALDQLVPLSGGRR